ncbi:MAG: queG [Burkholderiaceae bacterium]|nr:queG [Burkholderiaceae bacterium]
MTSPIDYAGLAAAIKRWGRELGFTDIRIADARLPQAEDGLQAWLADGRHGEMAYMAAHGMKRARPAELVPGTQRVIVARMDYLPRGNEASWRERELARLNDPVAATVSIYARGRDYHRVLRNRLQQLADRIMAEIGNFGYRAFTDSAPVMEVALAAQGGLGWRGKHTLLLNRDGGSLFFLGELLLDLPLPIDPPQAAHCGRCRACLDACPTQAITAPFQLDARRCISYLTIEHPGSIPPELRPLLGNRIYGCDDCQLACPWNRFARPSPLPDFDIRHELDGATLVELFGWSEEEFNRRLEGSPIRRIGHQRWLRNIAVAIGNMGNMGNTGNIGNLSGAGNAASEAQLQAGVAALQSQAAHPSEMVREHVGWALARLRQV